MNQFNQCTLIITWTNTISWYVHSGETHSIVRIRGQISGLKLSFPFPPPTILRHCEKGHEPCFYPLKLRLLVWYILIHVIIKYSRNLIVYLMMVLINFFINYGVFVLITHLINAYLKQMLIIWW